MFGPCCLQISLLEINAEPPLKKKKKRSMQNLDNANIFFNAHTIGICVQHTGTSEILLLEHTFGNGVRLIRKCNVNL